jgi:hypothetical protein
MVQDESTVIEMINMCKGFTDKVDTVNQRVTRLAVTLTGVIIALACTNCVTVIYIICYLYKK